MSLRALASEAIDERRQVSQPVQEFREAEFNAQVVDSHEGSPATRPRNPAPRSRSAPAPVGNAASAGALESLTRFFPTEVMTIYIPGVATFQSHFKPPEAALWMWALYGLMLFLTPGLIWLLFDKGMKAAEVTSREGLPRRQMLLGTASFALWGSSVPGVFPSAQWILGWVAIPAVILLAAINKKFS